MVAIQKPDAVVFDWDNTLVDTWPIIYAALVKTFEAFEMEPWTLDMVKNNVKKSMRDSFPVVFGDEWQQAGEIYQQAYRSRALAHLSPLDGALDTLELLHAKAIPMFVVSNKKGDNLRAELQHLKWNDYFVNVVGAGDADQDKPSGAPFWHAVKPHGLNDVGNVWFVGDSDVDLECAYNVGCIAILYGEHAKTFEDFTAHSLNGFSYGHYCENHQQLANLIDACSM